MKKLVFYFLASCTLIAIPYSCHSYNSEEWATVKFPTCEVQCAPQAPLSSSFYEILKHPPQWLLDQLNDEFAYYKAYSMPTMEDILVKIRQLKSGGKNFLLFRYKIINGQLCRKSLYGISDRYIPRIQSIDAALLRLHLTVCLPDDLDFIIAAKDALQPSDDVDLPIFCFGKQKGDHFAITIPDVEMLSGYETCLDAQIDTAIKTSPWDKKKDIAFWRGSTTGGNYLNDDWRDFPRVRLVYLAKKYNCIDAKFTRCVQGAKFNRQLLSDRSIFGSFILPKDSLQYRYLIDIDGNGSAWARLYWILRSNCTPFRQTSEYTMWYHRALKPFIHFIPYSNDTLDLPEMVEWAKSHSEDCKEIAQNSRDFVLNELTTEHAYAYLYLVLTKYYSLLTEKN
ncbi:MAG: glycosyl transferase family 90 [Chlamydiota bacterium]